MEIVGVGLRSVATIIDGVLLLTIAYLMALLTGGVSESGFSLQGLPFFLWVLISVGYYTAMEASYGATVGKFLVGLRVVMLEGRQPVDMQSSLVRNVLRVVDILFFYLVAAIAVWSSKSRQRIGDRVAGTVVVRSPRV